jgi:hypothetical protein
MNFMLAKDGWAVSFLEEDCRTSLPRHFVFQSELKIWTWPGTVARSSILPAAKRWNMASQWAEALCG